MQTDLIAAPSRSLALRLPLGRVLPPSLVLQAFAATLFLSAGLMFLVEPMVAKMVLPRLGGSPSVWSTCLVFFQATLLAGYAYAHASVRLLPRWGQIALHVVVLLPAAALLLPLDLGTGAPVPGAPPALWLLWRLTATVGLPVFAISATAPLLQTWFSRLDHAAAGDPYFLYAASNAGSLLALLAYPLAVEPNLTLHAQAAFWAAAFAALAVGIALCAGIFVARGTNAPRTLVARPASGSGLRERAGWTALAFVPSSLLLGVTTHITSDIVSAPLLWVIPLALYLLTFVLAFARRPLLPHAAMARAMPLLLIPLVVSIPPFLALPLHLACFFVIAMVCHGALAARRPDSARLTEFYFFLSLGGVLGGVFNALLAPLLFSNVVEYPLMLVAACAALPRPPAAGKHARLLDLLLPAALLTVVLTTRNIPLGENFAMRAVVATIGLMVPALALVNFSERRLRFALGIAACLFAPSAIDVRDTLATERSFFGVYRVRDVDDGRTRELIHGTTVHGVESLLPGEGMLPLGYYSHQGPFGRFFAALDGKPIRHVGVIGLGTGGLGCYAKPGQDWRFFEIDPLVERIARDTRYFHFLSECGNAPQVVLGDARLTLAGVPDGGFDLLVLDAFSSDSIPMHLLTREALALYLRKLAPGGLLLAHISNRTLDLEPLMAALAEDAGVQARVLLDLPAGTEVSSRRAATEVVAIAGRGGDLALLDGDAGWHALKPAPAGALWTDQRSDILRLIRRPF